MKKEDKTEMEHISIYIPKVYVEAIDRLAIVRKRPKKEDKEKQGVEKEKEPVKKEKEGSKLYGSRCELIRAAIRKFLVHELELTKNLDKAIQIHTESEQGDVEGKTYQIVGKR